MKRLALFVILCICLCGCSKSSNGLDVAIALRQRLLASDCTFEAEIKADYSDVVYEFTVSCSGYSDGHIEFTVNKPESIAGITGRLGSNGGQLTFDDVALAFPMLADGEISPVSAPWIFFNTLRSGYIRCCATEGDGLHLTIDDSYEEDALQLDIWLDAQQLPCKVQILWQGRSILSMNVSNFIFV